MPPDTATFTFAGITCPSVVTIAPRRLFWKTPLSQFWSLPYHPTSDRCHVENIAGHVIGNFPPSNNGCSPSLPETVPWFTPGGAIISTETALSATGLCYGVLAKEAKQRKSSCMACVPHWDMLAGTSRKKMTDSKNELDVEVEQGLGPCLRTALRIVNTLCGHLLYPLASRLPPGRRNSVCPIPSPCKVCKLLFEYKTE